MLPILRSLGSSRQPQQLVRQRLTRKPQPNPRTTTPQCLCLAALFCWKAVGKLSRITRQVLLPEVFLFSPKVMDVRAFGSMSAPKCFFSKISRVCPKFLRRGPGRPRDIRPKNFSLGRFFFGMLFLLTVGAFLLTAGKCV